METFSDEAENLVFHHETGVFSRVVLSLLGGFFIVMIFKDLVFSPVLWSWSVFSVPLWIITIGGLSVCVPMFVAGILGPKIQLDFDTKNSVVRKQTELDFGLRFLSSIPFSDVTKCEVAEMSSDDGPPRHKVVVTRKRFLFPRIDIETYASQEDAQQTCDRIRAVTGLAD